jgi:hypothetical protein
VFRGDAAKRANEGTKKRATEEAKRAKEMPKERRRRRH